MTASRAFCAWLANPESQIPNPALCALQRTIELIIEPSGGTTIALSFTALSARHTITLQNVIHAAERITELAMLNQRRTTD